MTGCEPTVTCRSDAPRATIVSSRSSIVYVVAADSVPRPSIGAPSERCYRQGGPVSEGQRENTPFEGTPSARERPISPAEPPHAHARSSSIKEESPNDSEARQEDHAERKTGGVSPHR